MCMKVRVCVCNVKEQVCVCIAIHTTGQKIGDFFLGADPELKEIIVNIMIEAMNSVFSASGSIQCIKQ